MWLICLTKRIEAKIFLKIVGLKVKKVVHIY